MTAAGYSATPLAAKLGIKAGSRVRLIDPPDGLMDWLAPLPPGVVFESTAGPATDIVHLFVTKQAELACQLSGLRQDLRGDAALWVLWPKKAAKLDTDITEDRIREHALTLGFVDVKVCAVSSVWSGLKLVVRKALR